METARERLNPIEMLKKFNWPSDHIQVDENIKGDYSIIRQSTHDGTMLFTYELIQKALINLANKTSFYKKDSVDFDKLKGINYVVSDITIATVFGNFEINGRLQYSQKDRVRIRVKPEYIY